MTDSQEYLAKKDFYANLLTIFGRKPVTEALQDKAIEPYRLHLAHTNRSTPAIDTIIQLAEQRGTEISHHSRDALSRISKNRKQDQGVVLDIKAPNYRPASALDPGKNSRVIALENVTNPQNIGMAIRSVGASKYSSLLLAKKGNAPLDGLVIKSSAGTVFKTPLFHCQTLLKTLPALKNQGYQICGLTGAATMSLSEIDLAEPTIFVLGNETSGLSESMLSLCDQQIRIPMSNGVESLNVSVAAALVAFHGTL